MDRFLTVVFIILCVLAIILISLMIGVLAYAIVKGMTL